MAVLANTRLPFLVWRQDRDRRLAVDREIKLPIMHYRVEIIRPIAARSILYVEVVPLTGVYVLIINSNVRVPVGSRLLVKESQQMSELMADNESEIPVEDVHVLSKELASNRRAVFVRVLDVYAVNEA